MPLTDKGRQELDKIYAREDKDWLESNDTPQQTGNDKKRILGHQRIFQSVFNDLNMKHELVTLEDGTKMYAYTYESPDPYELEDSAFPKTVKAISAHTEEASGCPCKLVEPCSSQCSCANGFMSGGCQRCCRHGSHEQRVKAAVYLASLNNSNGGTK